MKQPVQRCILGVGLNKDGVYSYWYLSDYDGSDKQMETAKRQSKETFQCVLEGRNVPTPANKPYTLSKK